MAIDSCNTSDSRNGDVCLIKWGREFRAVKKAMFPPALLPMRKVFEKST